MRLKRSLMVFTCSICSTSEPLEGLRPQKITAATSEPVWELGRNTWHSGVDLRFRSESAAVNSTENNYSNVHPYTGEIIRNSVEIDNFYSREVFCEFGPREGAKKLAQKLLFDWPVRWW